MIHEDRHEVNDVRPVDAELGVEILEATEDASADAGDLVLKQRRLVDLDDVGGRAQTVFHHELRAVRSEHYCC